MKAKTLQIVWHEKEPVYSLDFHPSGFLASGGADKSVKLWQVTEDADGCPAVSHLSSFSGLNHSVNVIRFSPNGDLLASGGDGGEVVLWKQVEDGQAVRGNLGGGQEGDGPVWKMCGSLRGHNGDVQDLSWAPDASAIVSGSIENLCILWDVEKRKGEARLENHNHYVQGVAWDPLGHFIVSQSNDRTCKVYGQRPPAITSASSRKNMGPPSAASLVKDFVMQATLSKRTMASETTVTESGDTIVKLGIPKPEASAAAAGADGAALEAAAAVVDPKPGQQKRHCLFHDESMGSFFRRLAWSPDGSVLAVPAGIFKADSEAPVLNTTYLFGRGDWASPLMHLPSLSKPVVAVRFCPTIFSLRESPEAAAPAVPSCFNLPYRMIFAVATMDSVLVYDTQSSDPLLLVGGLHIAAITDLAWAPDGRCLAVSSHDGYCSLVTFEQGELGSPAPINSLPPTVAACATKLAAKRFAERQAAAAAAADLKMVEKAAAAQQKAAATAAAAAVAAAKPIDLSNDSQDKDQAGAVPAATVARVSTTSQAGPRRIQPIASGTGPSAPNEAAPSGLKPEGGTGHAGPVPQGAAAATEGVCGGSKPAGPRRIQPMQVVQPPSTVAVGPGSGPAAGTPPPRRIQPEAVKQPPPSGQASTPSVEDKPPTPKAPAQATAATTPAAATPLVGCSAGQDSMPKPAPRRIVPSPIVRTSSTAAAQAAAVSGVPSTVQAQQQLLPAPAGAPASQTQPEGRATKPRTGVSIASLAAQAGVMAAASNQAQPPQSSTDTQAAGEGSAAKRARTAV